MPAKETTFLTPARLLGVSGFIIVSLIAVLGNFNNTRINALEEWRKATDASRLSRTTEFRTDIALTKERVTVMSEKVSELKAEIQRLRDDLADQKKRVR